MATLVNRVYVHTYVDELVAEGRTVTATITSTVLVEGEGAVTTINISEPSNMTEAELAGFQTIQALYDEAMSDLNDLAEAVFPPA